MRFRTSARYAAEIPQSLLAGATVLAVGVGLDTLASEFPFHSLAPWLRAFLPAAAATAVAALFYLWRQAAREGRSGTMQACPLPVTAFVELDADGTISAWPEAARSLFGYSRPEAEGLALPALFCEEDVERRAAEHQLRLARGNGHTDDRGWRRRKDGSRFWAGTRLMRQGSGFVVAVQDLSELKAAEDEAANQTALLNSVLDGTFDVITARSVDGRYRWVNASAAHLLAIGRNEAVGLTDAELLNREDAFRSSETDRFVLESGHARVYAEQLEIRGDLRTFLTHKAPWRDHQGNLLGVLTISTEYGEGIPQRQAVAAREVCAA